MIRLLQKSAASFLIGVFILSYFAPVFAEEASTSPSPAADAGTTTTATADSPAPTQLPSESAAPAPDLAAPPLDPSAPTDAMLPGDTTPQSTETAAELPSSQSPASEEGGTPPPAGPESSEDERLTPLYMRDPLKHAQEPGTDGSFVYTYPLRTPPGRNSIQPNLVLQYSSGNLDHHSFFGYGWSINIPYITVLNKKGVEYLYSTSTLYFYSSEDGELATTSGTTTTSWAARVEKGDFRQYTYSTSTGWTVTDKNGTTYTFGTTTSSRQDDSGNTTHIYKWMLDEVRDTNGNYMIYEYSKDRNEIYPSKIKYTYNATTSGVFEVEFLKESADLASSTATGFSVNTRYRIYEIDAKINGAWVTQYTLAYADGQNGPRDLLASITETGKDANGNSKSLPATSFGYQTLSTSQKTWTLNSSWAVPDYFTTTGNNDDGSRLGETNGDGLVDFLRKDALNNPATRVYTNTRNTTSNSWLSDFSMAIPSGIEFADGARDTGARLMEINGDGLVDIVKAKGGTQSVYINNGNDTGWTASTSWVVPVNFTSSDGLTDYGVNFGDVNGDGLIDMVKALSGSSSAVYLKKGDGTGWASSTSYSVPGVYFTNGTIDLGLRMEDINGDGLADLIQGSVQATGIYLNRGDGTGWMVDSNWNMPEAFTDNGADRGTRLMDINGDDLPDLVRRADYNTGTVQAVYINHGHAWEDISSQWDVTAGFVSSTSSDMGVRLGDVNGDGLIDLVQGYRSLANKIYISNAEVNDYLTGITESSGGRITVSYRGSGEYVSNDNIQNRDHPDIIQTVSTTTYNDSFGTIATTTYDYGGADYYYKNTLDRKFGGFKSIKRTDPYGNYTITYYHQGNTSSTTLGEFDDDVSKIGKPYRVERYNVYSDLMSKTISKWDMDDLGHDRKFPKLVQTVEYSYDGDGDHRDSAVGYTYNATGSIVGKVDWGEVTGSDDGTFTDLGTDLASTSISYAASSTGYFCSHPRR